MTDALPVPDRAATRQQLAEMRSRLTGNLGKQIDGGDLALLVNVQGAIAALDADGCASVAVPPGGRAILADDGQTITLTIYTEAAVTTGAALSAERAIALAGELIAAGLRRMRDERNDGGPNRPRLTIGDLDDR